MKSTVSKILLALAGTLIVALVVLFSRTGSAFICDHCGAMAGETDWYVPFTSVGVFHSNKDIAATPLSSALTSLGLVDAAAPHHWVLAHRLGNGGEDLGVGHSLFLTVRSDRVAALIRAARLAGDSIFCEQLVHCAFERETSPLVYHLAVSASPDAFADTPAYKAWRQEKAGEIQRFLHINPPNHAMQRIPQTRDC